MMTETKFDLVKLILNSLLAICLGIIVCIIGMK